MPLSPVEWHARFQQQAQWTQAVRSYLYQRGELDRAHRLLDLGCGTGVLCAELSQRTGATIYGLDLLFDRLAFAKSQTPAVHYTQGNGIALPYAAGSFDISLCHFVLLWVHEPQQVVIEMARVTRPDGFVLALAEPDYGGRIDYPPVLEKTGELQRSALQAQGADTRLGRRLREIFELCGLTEIEAGVLGGQWRGQPPGEEVRLEWQMLQDDLDGMVAVDLEQLRVEDQRAWREGSRILYVPTFYAIGRVIVD